MNLFGPDHSDIEASSLSFPSLIIKCCDKFWSKEDHVFRFGDQELCPLPEEFAICNLQAAQYTPAIIPTSDSNPYTLIPSLFLIPPFKVKGFLHRRVLIKLDSLLSYVKEHYTHKGNIFIYCLLSGLLLGTDSGEGDPQILPLIEP